MQQSAALGATVLLSGPVGLFAANHKERNALTNLISKGYAARDNSGKPLDI